MANFTCVYTKDNELRHITKLDETRMQYLMDHLPNKQEYELLDLYRGCNEESKYIIARMSMTISYSYGFDFWVKIPRYSDYPLGDMEIIFEDALNKSFEEIIVDTLVHCLPEYA